MSYEIAKYISVNAKKNKIFVTSAANNVHPRRFERWEFDETNNFDFMNKALKLSKCILNGSLQPISSCNHQKLKEDMFAALESVTRKVDLLTEDCRYHTNKLDECHDFIGRMIAIPYFLGKGYDLASIKEYLGNDFYRECLGYYSKRQEEYDAKGQVLIRSAISLSEYKGYDMLWSYNDEIIIAKKENYSRGILNNSDGKSLFLKNKTGETSKDTWEIMLYWPKEYGQRCWPELKGIDSADA